ncbi:Acid-sensing ion channel 2 [Liparis tanakae]|uniref:Acid-sensing ion channel 2 n=1 Tax=Liparis tanakae TaxID=230148 RepID=A0A4Z2GRQ1_9TELE|nr:Acid-sensing ion channel 2 [Liparis tanakae]
MVKAAEAAAAAAAPGPRKADDARETRLRKPESGSPTLKDVTVGFITRTKIHGLRFAFSPDKSKPQRVVWVVAFFVCVSLLCTWSWNRILYLMSYPAITKIYMVWAHSMAFPAVTFCNKNVFRVSSLTKEDLYHSGYWMDLMHPNHTVMERGLAVLRDGHRQGLLSLLDFRDYAPPSGYSVNTTEMMGRLGHQLEDVLLECRFRGEGCTHKNFSTVCTGEKGGGLSGVETNGVHEIYTRYGKCYTFNSGLDGNPLLTTLKGGTGNGLEIMLDIQQDEYLPVWGETEYHVMLEAEFDPHDDDNVYLRERF